MWLKYIHITNCIKKKYPQQISLKYIHITKFIKTTAHMLDRFYAQNQYFLDSIFLLLFKGIKTLGQHCLLKKKKKVYK